MGLAVEDEAVGLVAANGNGGGCRVVEEIGGRVAESEVVQAVAAVVTDVPADGAGGGVNVVEAEDVLDEEGYWTEGGPAAEVGTDALAVVAARGRCGRGLAFPDCVRFIVAPCAEHPRENLLGSCVGGLLKTIFLQCLDTHIGGRKPHRATPVPAVIRVEVRVVTRDGHPRDLSSEFVGTQGKFGHAPCLSLRRDFREHRPK